MAQTYGKILVPVDGSAASARGLQEAIKIAKALGSTLRVVHVVDELVVDYSGVGGTNYYTGDIIEGCVKPVRRSSPTPKQHTQNGLEAEAVLLEASAVRRRG